MAVPSLALLLMLVVLGGFFTLFGGNIGFSQTGNHGNSALFFLVLLSPALMVFSAIGIQPKTQSVPSADH